MITHINFEFLQVRFPAPCTIWSATDMMNGINCQGEMTPVFLSLVPADLDDESINFEKNIKHRALHFRV